MSKALEELKGLLGTKDLKEAKKKISEASESGDEDRC